MQTVFEYKLTNDAEFPMITAIIKNKNIEIKLYNNEEKIIYSNDQRLGFWNNEKKLIPLMESLKSLNITTDKDGHRFMCADFLLLIKQYFNLKKIPAGFEVDNGLYSIEEDKEGNIKRKIISYTPVWPICKYNNLDAGNMMLDLAFYGTYDELNIVTLSHKDAFLRKGIMEIAAHGALLEESKAHAMINWLVNYINKNIIPVEYVFERFGWKDDNAFVVGERSYSPGDCKNVKIINVPNKSIRGLDIKGNVTDWLQYTKGILKYDKARFKCYASCAAPLLKLLNQKSFIIHDYGESSTGKTKTSELAMSIWGDPSKLIMSSFGTAVGKERLATIFTDLPIFIDETQISNEEDNKTFVYLIANETGKLRGLKEGGLQDTANWKTVAFTTGEAPLTSDKSFMGLSVRVIELYGGLGAHDKQAVDDFKSGIENCYGVLGPYIIQEIFDNQNKLAGYYNDVYKKFNTMTNNSNNILEGVGGRVANMFALLTLGGLIFESVISKFGFEPRNAGEICVSIFNEYVHTMATSGYSYKAFEFFKSWISTKHKYFLVDMMELDSRGPYDLYGNLHANYVDIYPSVLKNILKEGDFNYNRVMKDWSENGTLVMYEDSNGTLHRNHPIRFFDKIKKVNRVIID